MSEGDETAVKYWEWFLSDNLEKWVNYFKNNLFQSNLKIVLFLLKSDFSLIWVTYFNAVLKSMAAEQQTERRKMKLTKFTKKTVKCGAGQVKWDFFPSCIGFQWSFCWEIYPNQYLNTFWQERGQLFCLSCTPDFLFSQSLPSCYFVLPISAQQTGL